jgi:Na+/proline symporter
LTSYEINNGLVLPYTAQAILGTGGAGAVLTMVFMAVTSTTSAQLIAVSSIVSFDIYKQYIKPHAKDHEMIRVAHMGVVGFALFAGGFSIMLHYIGLSLAWLDYFLGVVTCPGIIPTVLTVMWKGQTKTAAIVSPILGMITGFAVWLGATKALYGEVNVTTSGSQLSCMYGVIASFVSPGIYTVVISLIKVSP